MPEKRNPKRMCIVCREMHDKKELIRLVAGSNGQIIADIEFKLPGRGAYVCKNTQCIEKMKKQKVLSRTFRREVKDAEYELLTEAINAICSGQN